MTTSAVAPDGSPGMRVLWLWIRPEIRRSHVYSLFFVSFFGIAMMNTMGLLQPYVLNQILRIPPNEQGSLTANLLTLQEIVQVALLSLVGAMSDRFGRRPIFAAGFLFLALGYCLYPLAGGKYELAAFRLFVATGISCINAMLIAVGNDYPMEKSRAKMIAAVFICNGIGIATLPRLIGSLPQMFIQRGFDPVQGGRLAFWCVASLCVFLALIVLRGLKPGAPGQVSAREPILATMRVGFAAARNPRIALGYAAAVVSRADLAVVSTYLSLWLMSEGISRGLTAAESLKKATIFYVIIQAMAVPWAPIFGWILDRIDRIVGLMGAMVIAGIGYGSLGLLKNPLGNEMYLAAVMVGIGEMAANISATSLIGKEAPDRGRGAIMGTFSLCGALGIIVIAQVGGYVSDLGFRVGPFIVMSIANALLLVLATLVFLSTRRTDTVAARATVPGS
jgi:MFS family permease